MKISELPKLSGLRRDIELPLAVQEENYSITMGQIMDAMPQGVVQFGLLQDSTENVQYMDGEPPLNIGMVIFDRATNKFYYGIMQMSGSIGNQTEKWIYYSQWQTRDKYYDGNAVKQGCLFVASDGQPYFFNGTTLKSVGISEAQATQIRHNTPIEVESEEIMEWMIAAGEVEEGQIYFVAE